jgi:hypothetical protein
VVYGLPDRPFSATAQSTASISMSESVLPDPPGRPLAITSTPWAASGCRNSWNHVPSARQAPLPHATTGIGSSTSARFDGR